MFPGHDYLYYIPIGLQAFCVFHSLKNGTQQKWIWIIVFLPVIGSLVYIYQEILNNRRISAPKIDVGAVLNPGGKLKKLEDQVRFTDTFANRMQLADAYLNSGFTDKAIEIYKTSLTGAFAENEHALMQLMVAYSKQESYAEVLPLAKKVYKLPQFIRSRAHIAYAEALEHTGNITQAEEEYKAMKGRYSYFEQRYQYGLFLVRQERYEDAEKIFEAMLEEQPHLSQMERKSSRLWFAKAKEELKRVQSAT
ncbi:hypothetical protein DYU05_10480 [Mucilaginibacter terrenus]|uniref:Cardiolipin synthase N-terminal domain-containing protein n=1 Tax=Mucilaginibacter terrenus TaxID=2482727 RepID=A0A3E2NY97_9SPHI|nr:hypothetical protein [Mucilaginibacter terrenus]RFZ85984.1 hypothetical protein DYU05_10480 [Mucilaginibacter terrenus]